MSESEKYEKYKKLYFKFRPKIFGIGLNKTGTSSLGDYFEQLGYKLYCKPTSKNIDVAKKNPEYFDSIIEEYHVFEDWPWPLLYKYIYDKYPTSKFILTMRENSEIWFDSLYRHSKRTGPTEQRKQIYGYHDPDPNDIKNKTKHIEIYNKYYDQVVEFFKSHDEKRLLILYIDDKEKEKKIYDFIGREFNKYNFIKYPHSNRDWKNTPKTTGGGKMPAKLLDYDYYFIHIPKNAGTSFIKTLCGDRQIGLIRMKSIDDINIVKKTITLTRNPFDRLYSIYSYTKLGKEKSYWKKNEALFNYVRKNSFEKFVNDLYTGKLVFNDQIHLTPQYKFIQWKDGKIHNILVKIEHLDSSLRKLLGKKIDLPKLNESKDVNDWEKHYTPDMKKKVYSLYKKDFKLLGYGISSEKN